VILARAPWSPGKTRLVEGSDPARARALREALLLDTLDRVREVGVACMVACTPDDADVGMRRLLSGVTVVPQGSGDLGERMARALAGALARGADQVALVGSDLPALPPAHVAAAFALLDAGADLVLGPAEDGGFYLMAAAAPLPPLFDGIEWGRGDVLDRVIGAARAAGLDVRLAPRWWDVDVPADLERVRRVCPASRVARLL
jgi:rSAM/selenodomain-associated transferase 1